MIGSPGHISTTFPHIGKTFKLVMSSAMSLACRLRATQVGVFLVVVFRIWWYSPTQRIYGGWYIYLSITTQLQSLRIQICPKISGFPRKNMKKSCSRDGIETNNPTNFREGSGFLGNYHQNQPNVGKMPDMNPMGYVFLQLQGGPRKTTYKRGFQLAPTTTHWYSAIYSRGPPCTRLGYLLLRYEWYTHIHSYMDGQSR